MMIRYTDLNLDPTVPPPWAHQRASVEEDAEKRVFALEFEPRCGKSRTAIEHLVYHYDHGTVDAALVVAWPNGVPAAWVRDHFPTWLPGRIPRMLLCWRAGFDKNKTFRREFDSLLKFRGLAVFAVNAEALSRKTAAVKKFIHTFIEARKVFGIADEVDFAMTPGSARTECVTLIMNRPNVLVKRILSGTMTTDSPFELYSQYEILDRRILGFRSYQAYRHRYGEYPMGWVPKTRWVTRGGRYMEIPVTDPATGKPKLVWGIVRRQNHSTNTLFEELVRDTQGRPQYRNLDELKAKIDPHRRRVLRRDVSGAPAKVYIPWYYAMSTEQSRVYGELRDTFVSQLSAGAFIKAPHVLTRMLRLQQVLGNHSPATREGVVCVTCAGDGCEQCDGAGILVVDHAARPVDPENDPRLERLVAGLEAERMPTVVWARFRAEVDAIVAHFMAAGRPVARYDGAVSQQARDRGVQQFQSGEVDLLVGNQDAGGRNLRLDAARLMVFYSNTFSRRTRIQAEDRAEHPDRTVATDVVDLMCEGSTMDQTLVASHRAKEEIAALITGDNWRRFL